MTSTPPVVEPLAPLVLSSDATRLGANVLIAGTHGDTLTLDNPTVAQFDKAIGDFKLV